MLLGGLFSGLLDQRRARGKRYQQEPLLCALLLAVLCGATSLRKMELFIEERLDQLNVLFGTSWKKAPTWVGIRRFLLKIDPEAIEEVVFSPPSRSKAIADDSGHPFHSHGWQGIARERVTCDGPARAPAGIGIHAG